MKVRSIDLRDDARDHLVRHLLGELTESVNALFDLSPAARAIAKLQHYQINELGKALDDDFVGKPDDDYF